MDTNPYHIQSHCTIRQRTIRVDGDIFLETEASVSLPDFLKTAYRQLSIDYPKFHKMDPLCKAIFIATELMAQRNGPYAPDTALVFSNYSSSHFSDDKHASAIFDSENPSASPATFVYTLPNIAMGEVSIRHQLHSENVFFIFDSYLPEFLAPYNDALLDQRQASSIISGWVEVGQEECDVLLYLIGKSGSIPHTIEHLNALYNNGNE